MAVVILSIQDISEAQLNIYVARECHRPGLGFHRGPLWLRKTTTLPVGEAAPRVYEIRLWRMDSDICDTDVDQNLDLPLLDADTRLEETHPTAPRRHRVSDIVKHHPDDTLDRPVSTCGQSLGHQNQWIMFHPGSVGADHHLSGWYGKSVFTGCISFTDELIVISAISDFTFASYPVVILWQVQMKLKTKIALCALMGVSVLSVSPRFCSMF